MGATLFCGLLVAAVAWFPTSAGVADASGGGTIQAACGPVPAGFARCLLLEVKNTQAARPLVGSAPSGFLPADLQSAYNLPSAGAGRGQTVAIVDAYDDPSAEADLGAYRAQFGIAPCTSTNGCFRKV